jgi:hypothetical protein
VDGKRVGIDGRVVRCVLFLKERRPMANEDQLREWLRKVEALFFGATTAGERDVAGAAAERLKERLRDASRAVHRSS